MTDFPPELPDRLDDFSRRLEVLERELAELRQVTVATPAAPSIPPPPVVPPEPIVARPAPHPPAPPRMPPPPPLAPPRPRRELDWSVLLGAKALAWAGGAVMLLGIVFFLSWR